MPQQITISVENNFTKGLITEATGLNFPENAATDTDNCTYTLVGNVIRREGIDNEVNHSFNYADKTDKAISTYKWNNASGDGETQILVKQVGNILYFYRTSDANTDSPISNTLLSTTVDLSSQVVIEGTDPSEVECQYSDGNGYLIVYHIDCNPFYCTLFNDEVTAFPIDIQIRDFSGVIDGLDAKTRPTDLTNAHLYNLQNQGWVQGNRWYVRSNTYLNPGPGNNSFYVGTGYPIELGDIVTAQTNNPGNPNFNPAKISGNVVAYSSDGWVTINAVYADVSAPGKYTGPWDLYPTSSGYINDFKTAVGLYPSNSDVWWYFKDGTGAYNPAETNSGVVPSYGEAPKGFYILEAFNQQKGIISGVSGIDSIVTNQRPTTGAWFQGRVWYAGVNASQDATPTTNYYSWTENIYFSQVVVDNTQFGKCYQVNDPTSEKLFDLLPTDGGVITIQGCGAIYKLFPIQNGMLVFAANGIWFITGSQGIGFTANDYTITKISSIESISSTSFVNVQGLPYFWNEEGIYTVAPSPQGLGLQVDPITINTIKSFYNKIPIQSKKYVRGDYNPIEYTIQWVYRDEEESGIVNRYDFNRMMNYNVANKAFYPYSIDVTNTKIHDAVYVTYPGDVVNSPRPCFKYLTSKPEGITYSFTFAEEYDDSYLDWKSVDTVGKDYSSYFITGYKLRGQGLRKFQLGYIYVYSDAEVPTAYKIQGIWDYANSPNSGKYTNIQLITNALTRFGKIFRRHKIRGRGLALQLKISSATGMPFNISGWSVSDTVNTGA